MGLFRKRPAAPLPTVAESLDKLVASSGQPSLFAHSEFVKQVTCPACGAPLSFPVGSSGTECPYCHSGTPPSLARKEDGPAGGARRAGPS